MLNHRKTKFTGDKYRSLDKLTNYEDEAFENMNAYFNRLKNAFLDLTRSKLNLSSGDFEKLVAKCEFISKTCGMKRVDLTMVF